MKSKQKILIKIIVDSREKDLKWLSKFKFDKKYGTDKIMILDYEIRKPFKCLDYKNNEIHTSTGDIGIEYSLDDGLSWNKTNLSIELKRETDFSSTLYSSWTRFTNEIKRALEYKLDFCVIYNQSTKQMYEHFDKLKYMHRISKFSFPEKIVYDRMVELQKDYHIPMFYTHEIEEMVKRVIKHHIKQYKLQYK